MFAVELYAAVRRFVFNEGHSRREAARVFGLSRDTVAKMCRYSAPPGYVRTRPPDRPKLGPLVPVIDAILEADKTAPPKQRHTAKRIFERLRDEHSFAGGYTVVKDYVRLARSRTREVFIPLAHPPGHAQVDFGECVAVIGGVTMKLHVFCFDLPQSDACFLKAYATETTEAFLARISHGIRCIGAENQRKLFCENNLAGSRRFPRCRRSVDRNRWGLHASKAVAWSPILTAAR
jgi:transposase